ncbi:hypothetical protein GCM10027093_16680 [Paraburkholderia jirisanensis]
MNYVEIIVYFWIYASGLDDGLATGAEYSDLAKAFGAPPCRARIAVFVVCKGTKVAFLRTVLLVVVGVMSGSAAAVAEYKEVWNPPEANAHAAHGKSASAGAPAKKPAATQRAGKTSVPVAGTSSKAGAKRPATSAAASRPAAKQATATSHATNKGSAPRTASAVKPAKAKATTAKATTAKTLAKTSVAKTAAARSVAAQPATVAAGSKRAEAANSLTPPPSTAAPSATTPTSMTAPTPTIAPPRALPPILK